MARLVPSANPAEATILLAIEDVTGARHAAGELQRGKNAAEEASHAIWTVGGTRW